MFITKSSCIILRNEAVIVSVDRGRVGMDRVGMVLYLVAEFVMGRVCQGPSLSWTEFVMGRDVPESFIL